MFLGCLNKFTTNNWNLRNKYHRLSSNIEFNPFQAICKGFSNLKIIVSEHHDWSSLGVKHVTAIKNHTLVSLVSCRFDLQAIQSFFACRGWETADRWQASQLQFCPSRSSPMSESSPGPGPSPWPCTSAPRYYDTLLPRLPLSGKLIIRPQWSHMGPRGPPRSQTVTACHTITLSKTSDDCQVSI